MRAVRADDEVRFQHLSRRQREHGRVVAHVEALCARIEPREVRLEPQRGVERRLDQRRFGDPCELRHGRLVRGEMQFRVRVAVHAHVVDRRKPAVIERLPDAQPLEQRLRTGGQRIDARVEGEIGGARRGRLGEQGCLVAGLGQRERGRLADLPPPTTATSKVWWAVMAGIIAAGPNPYAAGLCGKSAESQADAAARRPAASAIRRPPGIRGVGTVQ